MPAIERKVLTGWGRVAGTVADVASPTTVDEVSALMASPGPRGVIPRGLGRAYGDAAQDSGGLVIDLTGLDSTLRVDHSSHQVTASTGHSLDHLMRVLVPQGYWVPVSPGTRNVSLGGALAADVHGKNHHVDGSFGNAVRELTLVAPGGDVRTLTPDGTPEEFWATVGGMGLTGAIVEARFDAHPIETSRASVDTERADNLDEALAMMSASDDLYRYTVNLDRPDGQGRAPGSQRADTWRLRDTRPAAGQAARRSAGLWSESAGRGATLGTAEVAQPGDDRRIQRDVVPQGTEGPAG